MLILIAGGLLFLANTTNGFAPSIPLPMPFTGRTWLYDGSMTMLTTPRRQYVSTSKTGTYGRHVTLFQPPHHLDATSDRRCKTMVMVSSSDNQIPGDEAGYFNLEEQSLSDWIKFTVATATVLLLTSYVWFLPAGPHLGDGFLDTVQDVTGTTDPAVTVTGMLVVFAVAHSGLAGLRPYAEQVVGARSWRVVFACVSLPLALSCISYFVNHAHEGRHLWTAPPLHDHPVLHSVYWTVNFVSFLLLYPSTFNLLEVAAIEKPQLHLWRPSGVIRITRHPQAVGQVLWCAAHTACLGTTTAVAASTILVLHHAYSVWHGDRRMRAEHGEAFERVREVTSVLPFQAVWEGRQELPPDYLLEFATGPYALVVTGTVLAYLAHPYMLAGAALLQW